VMTAVTPSGGRAVPPRAEGSSSPGR
jgi:hypothetical protein